MAITSGQKHRILRALKERVPDTVTCPLCHHSRWALSEGFYLLVVQDDPAVVHLGGKGLPLIALTCENCGNTHLLNALLLGLQDELGIKPATADG